MKTNTFCPFAIIAIVFGIQRHPNTNNAVLMMGTSADAVNIAVSALFLSIKRNAQPATNPATVVFTKQIIVVTNGLFDQMI